MTVYNNATIRDTLGPLHTGDEVHLDLPTVQLPIVRCDLGEGQTAVVTLPVPFRLDIRIGQTVETRPFLAKVAALAPKIEKFLAELQHEIRDEFLESELVLKADA